MTDTNQKLRDPWLIVAAVCYAMFWASVIGLIIYKCGVRHVCN